MKIFSCALAIFTLSVTPLFSLELDPSILEFGKLRFTKPFSELSGNQEVFSQGIVLNDGDVMQILNFTSSHLELSTTNGHHSSTGGFVTVYTYDSEETGYERITKHNSSATVVTVRNELLGGFIVGPTTVYIGTPPSSNYNWNTGLRTTLKVVLHYAIQRNNPLGYKNVNVISLPSATVGAGTHEIVVEASDDLQTWTPVHSSSIGGNKAFFRTRVVESGN